MARGVSHGLENYVCNRQPRSQNHERKTVMAAACLAAAAASVAVISNFCVSCSGDEVFCLKFNLNFFLDVS